MLRVKQDHSPYMVRIGRITGGLLFWLSVDVIHSLMMLNLKPTLITVCRCTLWNIQIICYQNAIIIIILTFIKEKLKEISSPVTKWWVLLCYIFNFSFMLKDMCALTQFMYILILLLLITKCHNIAVTVLKGKIFRCNIQGCH